MVCNRMGIFSLTDGASAILKQGPDVNTGDTPPVQTRSGTWRYASFHSWRKACGASACDS